MVFKHLDELTASELRIELKRAGIKGKYVKAQAIMRLTTHLIDISEDPLTFEFDPEMPIEEVGDDGGGPDEYEVLNDAPEAQPASSDNAGGSAASVSGLVNSIAAGTFTTTPPVTTATPFVSAASATTASATTASTAASISTSTFTTSSASASASFPYQNAGMGQYPNGQNVGMVQYPNGQFMMQNPYNPVMFPGMPGGNYYPQYQGMPPNPANPGVSQVGQAPPQYNAVWTPWGGWVPMSQASPTPSVPVTTSSTPRTSSGTSFTLNPAMADFTGACPPPARNSDTRSTKITSGQFDSGRREVKERQNWPQVMIDHILNPETVDYDEMDWASLTAGMTGKILAEMDPSAMDTATVNKLKHLNRLANYGMKTPMKSILNFNAVMFRAVENQALTWQDWDKIDQFHTRHLSSLTVAAATSGVGKSTSGSASASGSGSGVPSKKPSWDILRKSMTAHHMCFKFNQGKCDQEEDHDSNGNGKILLHACGACVHAERGIVKNHGAKECKPDFWPAPFRSQHRTTGGGPVQQN